jgi:hypothetical protein
MSGARGKRNRRRNRVMFQGQPAFTVPYQPEAPQPNFFSPASHVSLTLIAEILSASVV